MLWSFVPQEMHHWWEPIIGDIHKSHDECTIKNPMSFVWDMTQLHKHLTIPAEELQLGELAETLDCELHPINQCPWGCTEHVHECGTFPLDIAMAHFVGGQVTTCECFKDC